MRGGPASAQTRRQRWLAALAQVPPASFSLVMATGIVSQGAQMMGWPWIAQALFALNVLQYALLWLLYLLRASLQPRLFFGDMVNHQRGPGYFTLVAGTGILASQCVLLRGLVGAGWVLGILAAGLWLVLTYAIFSAFAVKRDKPRLDEGISGLWLLAVVATQSLAAIATLLGGYADLRLQPGLNLFSLSMWLCGGMLYMLMMALIFYRWMFLRLEPGDLSPPYWINMGAMAISTLAGALLIEQSGHLPLLQALRPFLLGVTLLYWVTGSWWIPVLLVLGVWRHGMMRQPIRYDLQYWAMVFPLGMYAACTWKMGEAMGFGFLQELSYLVWWAALLAWALTFAGMLRRLAARLYSLI